MVSPRLKYPRVNGKYTLRTMVAAVTKAVKTTVKAIWEDFTVSYVSQPIDIFLSPTT
jgi:hypothetical protein